MLECEFNVKRFTKDTELWYNLLKYIGGYKNEWHDTIKDFSDLVNCNETLL